MMLRRRLFTIGHTTVWLHLVTLLFVAYAALAGYGRVMVVAMTSILIHEAAHAGVAAFFGQPPGEIEITPLGALMRLEDEELIPPLRRIIVLMAGPLASMALCWSGWILTKSGVFPQDVGRILFMCNLLLTMGNLLPALPLDGGRMLALLLGRMVNGEWVRRIMLCIGTVTGLGCIGLNLLLTLKYGGWNFSCAMVGCVIMYAGTACTTAAALAELRQFIDRKQRLERRGTLMCRWVAVSRDLPLRHALSRLAPHAHTMFVLTGYQTNGRPVFFSEEAIICAYLNDSSGDFGALMQESKQPDSN